jgi:octaprenyl-diphosphate synthase
LRKSSILIGPKQVLQNGITRLIETDLRALDSVIEGWLHSDIALVRQVCEHIISSGGKRLRPALLMLSAECFGHRESDQKVFGDKKVLLAAVIEFIHTATLLHDDVVDESQLRRARPTANAMFGNAASVLVGDFLYSRAFQMMVRAGNMRVMQVLADATNAISEGEVLQLMNCHDPDVDEERYRRVVHLKTAKLFEAAARIGAILGGASPEQEQSLADYGRHVGIAFQLIDDALDYSGDVREMGKNLGDDLAEGKPTLPLIHALRQATDGQRELLRRAIVDGAEEPLEAIISAVRGSGALEYTRAQAVKEAHAARAAIAAIPHSHYRQGLIEFADFAVARSF